MLNKSFISLLQSTGNDNSSQVVQTLNLVFLHLTTYFGCFLIIFGNFNSIFVILLFLRYKSFRQNTCSNYLLLCSLCDLFQLNFGYIFRYLADSLFQYNLTAKSSFLCKFRFFLTQTTIMCSLVSLLMGSIDRYIHTSYKEHWLKTIFLKHTRIFIVLLVLICIILSSPSLYYIDIYSNQCYAPPDSWYLYYMHIFFFLLCLIIPLILMPFFGYLTIKNINNTIHHSRWIHINERIRYFQMQVTHMLLIQVLFTALFSFPYAIYILYEIITFKMYKTMKRRMIEDLISRELRLLLNIHSCDNLYTYLMVSPVLRAKLSAHFQCYKSKITKKNIQKTDV
ncbi:hypothetical protein I4U23_011130 [Adineta vaga]|nr:hypothetical protein I4U23_011130 [Adineta vaga]